MSFFKKAGLISVGLLSIFIGIKINNLYKVPPLPNYEDVWWGPGKAVKLDSTIKPFKINVSNEDLNDLKQRLENHRPFVPPLEGIQQQYGMNTDLLNAIVEFWKTSYNWREREKILNQYPQYTVNVQGLNIHYLHVKPAPTAAGKKVLPLLLLHGWPGSVREFYEIIPLLTASPKDFDFVFELIIPSLPGYGFSDAAARPGLDIVQMAVLFRNFMNRIGFEKYYVQGGDWGAGVVQNMATLYPDNVLGMHSNMCFVDSALARMKLFLGSFWPSLVVEKEHEDKVYPLSNTFFEIMLEMGYMHLQATKPDTVGVALNDSPAGLAAYIIEKFSTWTSKSFRNRADGGLKERYSFTKLLDNVMIYWISGSVTTSMRLYAETLSKDFVEKDIPIKVPSACARFANDVMFMPTSILKLKFHNLVHVSDHKFGHFAAFEVPDVLATDIFVAVRKILSASNGDKS